MKKIVYGSLVLIWLLVIFFFSQQTGKASRALTTSSIGKVISATSKDTTVDTKPKQKEKFIDKLIKPVRKSAHFLEFFVLGFLVYVFLTEIKIHPKKCFVYAILFCVFYACTDELHQLFVADRTSRLLDVCIDSAGSFVAILILYIYRNKKKSGVINENSV